MRSSIIALSFLLTTVLADGAAIVSSLETITAATISLNTTIAKWPGTLLTAFPIITESTTLLKDIKSATSVAEASTPLSDLEAFNVAIATLALSSDVNSTLETIIAKKRKFDRLLLGPIILLNLKLEKDATEEFGAAVVEKVPEGLKGAAETLVAGISDSFEKAIDVYDFDFV